MNHRRPVAEVIADEESPEALINRLALLPPRNFLLQQKPGATPLRVVWRTGATSAKNLRESWATSFRQRDMTLPLAVYLHIQRWVNLQTRS